LRERYLGCPRDIFYFNGKRVAAKGIQGFVPLVEDVPLKYVKETFL
jgi:hypothetical protein